MNSTPSEYTHNPTHFGGEGLYQSAGADEAQSLKAPLGEFLDNRTKKSLQRAARPESSIMDMAKRNPIPAALAVGGLVWLLATLTRRSMRS